MQQIIIERWMNIAGSVARERNQIESREIETNRFVVPQTCRAKAKETVRERGEENEQKNKTRGEFKTPIHLFRRLGLEHDFFGKREEERAELLKRDGADH